MSAKTAQSVQSDGFTPIDPKEWPTLPATWSSVDNGETWVWGDFFLTFQKEPKTFATRIIYHYSMSVFYRCDKNPHGPSWLPIMIIALEEAVINGEDMPLMVGLFTAAARYNFGTYEGAPSPQAVQKRFFEILGPRLGRDDQPKKIGDMAQAHGHPETGLGCLSYTLMQLDRYEEALLAFDADMEHAPENSGLWSNKGIALSMLQRYDEAVAAFEQAIRLAPEDIRLWCNKSNALAEAGRDEEALEACDKAIELDPEHSDTWENKRHVMMDVLKRDEEAVNWLRKAAEQGGVYAQLHLGICYAEGHRIPQDFVKAASWFRKAAEQGHAYAQSSLGVCYRKGLGVRKNSVTAYTCFLLAERGGESVKAIMSVLEKELSPRQIAKARKNAGIMLD